MQLLVFFFFVFGSFFIKNFFLVFRVSSEARDDQKWFYYISYNLDKHFKSVIFEDEDICWKQVISVENFATFFRLLPQPFHNANSFQIKKQFK